MGYSDNLHSYLNMTRKELQQLCKKHKIPANRSHAHLAKSLASLCKKKSVKSTFPKKRKGGPSLISEKNVTEKLTPLTENTQGSYERLISSVGGIHNQVKFLCTTSLEKPQINANTVHPITANYRSLKYSTPNLGNLGESYPAAFDIHKQNATRLLGFVGNEIGKRNRFPEPGNSNQKFLHDAFTISRTCSCNTAMMHCEHNKAIKCSTESGFVSADEISTRVPSFQFFVMSEAGLNLCVDLESNPVEWINSLKDEVCIHQKGVSQSSARSCGLPHADNNVENLPYGDTGIKLQSNEVEQTNECTNSSLSSVVSENADSEAYLPDTTIAASGSSVLTSGNAPAVLGCMEENQVVSSSHFTHFTQENLTTDIVRAHGDPVFVHDVADASRGTAKNDASLSDAPLKATINADDATIVCPINTTTADYGDIKASAPSNTTDHVFAKHNLSDEVKHTLEHFGSIKNQSEVVEDLISGPHMSEVPDKACRNGGSPILCQFTGQVVLDGGTTDAQSEVGTANDHLNRQACGSCETSVLDVPLSSLNDEMVCSTPTKGKDSGSARAESSLDNNCKRSNSLELLEVLPSKKQHVCCENTKEAPIHIKGTKCLAKETTSDAAITPRRSTRLVPK